ncbi:putative membrane protein ActII-3 [Catellatospora citrea]|uniref:Putative membrane protein ActII-3 n=2 Tax=Catellatospora citrea TaxID=53366 RepID=A0A8J3P2Q9_9ACTN|nr:MMPL family transporter [Catellatospora citrea]RKE00351.1 RND superfamily putative drug exporter [Catellatospora citrea]GIF99440.1 putative membrane protein ActII-3 [Catellatospora citrea]
MPARSRWRPSRLLEYYAISVVWLRWVVVALWIAAVAASVLYLPAIGHGGSDLGQLVSADNAAVRSEVRSFEKFGFPLLSRVSVVQRNPAGLPLSVQAEAVARARDLTEGKFPDAAPILAAVPVTNTLQLMPGSQENGTTVITMLFTAPDVTFAGQLAAAEKFVAAHYDADDAVVGVTGSVPARVEQSDLVLSTLPWLEAVTVAAVFLIVAIAFRSLIAPLLALGVAGVAIVLTLHVGGALADRLGVPVPQETQPLLVALLLGVVTDYVVFYLAAVRTQLAAGAGRLEAAEHATARFTPIIATAGATAAAGTGALVVAGSAAFRAFGPGMALAVLIGMLVAVTLVPALLAILGRAVLWSPRRGAATEPDAAPEVGSGRWSRLLTRPWVAAPVLLLCVGGLVAAALPVRDLALGVSFVEALPADHPTRQAAVQAQTGFAEGILSPTELLVEGPGVAAKDKELDGLQQALRKVPGVAAVLGPGDDIVPQDLHVFRTPDATAARYLLVLSDEPLGARAVQTLSRLQHDLPGLVRAAGLTDVRTSLGGDTAIAQLIVDQTKHDLGRIALAALVANLLFLVLFLRALVAPIGLLACSVLAIGATLGVTTWLFQDVLGADGLTFYVPFAAAVLLVALGSDYNIFGIGPAWKEARGRPLREALAITLPQSAHAIRIAAFTLAVSFGLLALVPLRPFRELAFALSVGILIDAFIVRSILAPALLTVLGSASEWPGRRLSGRIAALHRPHAARPGDEPATAAATE